MQDRIRNRLVEMNWRFGRGEVVGVDFGTMTVTRRIPVTQRTGFNETRKFRINRDTVLFLGHQSSLKRRSKP
jgi:hypothetical protein